MENNTDIEEVNFEAKDSTINLEDFDKLKRENKRLKGCLTVVIIFIAIGIIGFSVCLASF